MSKEEIKVPVEATPPVVVTEQRNETASPSAPVPGSGSGNPGDAQTRAAENNQSIDAERTRSAAIIDAVSKAGLEPSLALEYIRSGSPIDQVRAAIIEKWAANGSPQHRNTASMKGDDQIDHMRKGMTAAIAYRAMPSGEMPEEARPYANLSLLRMGAMVLETRGTNTSGLYDRDIALQALNTRGYMSMSDFPLILGNTVNRTLQRAYGLAPRTFTAWAQRSTNKDFRTKTVVQLSGLVKGFEEVFEGGEYKYDSMTEKAESVRVKKYGRIISITWETLINDDLDAFSRIPTAIANQAANLQSDIMYGLLTGSPVMGDGIALFNASHNNLAASGTVLDEASLRAARLAMRKQKGLNNKDFLNLNPTILVVGPERETEAQKLLQATIVATKTADTNIFKGSMQLVVDPRITDYSFYIFADTSMIDTIQYAFLEGESELFTERKESFDVDGVQIKARTVFGAAPIDFRGIYKNAGAAS